MKHALAVVISLCLMLTIGYAEDMPDPLPKLEVTALATCKDASKVRAILNNHIVKKGDIFEVTDGKLGAKVVKPKKVKKKGKKKAVTIPPVKIADQLLEIGKITKKGVTVHYTDSKTKYIETRLIPLKGRDKRYGLHL